MEHVLLVGVGGGVPHYTDYARHVRLGDVVLSGVGTTASFIYQQCDSAKVKRPNEKLERNTRLLIFLAPILNFVLFYCCFCFNIKILYVYKIQCSLV